MKIDFTGRGFEITPAVRNHTQSKLERLIKHLDEIRDVTVVLSVEKYRHKCEINFLSKRRSFHGAEETDEMLASIDGVVDKLEKQARKFKTQRTTGQRKGQVTIRSNGEELAAKATASQEKRVIRARRSQIKPMTVEEAVDAMQKAEQEFLIFHNAENDALGVVFRRKDGHFGFVDATN